MPALSREEIADVLARAYDGQPLTQLRDEHAAHHLEAADAVLARITGHPQEDPTDRRRRLYIDGKGVAWLSLSHDRGIQYIGRLAGAFDGDDTTTSVRERTGSLREIGRCW